MKQQYFGDVSDYRKYGVLRCFSDGGFRIGLLWMLTADDGRTDGQRTDYLRDPGKWRRFDPELFDFLHDTVFLEGRRDIAAFERAALLPRGLFYSALLTDSGSDRERYFARALQALAGADLVFFDPDNGLEVRSVRYGAAGSCRYLYWNELEQTWSAGHSLLIFQHYKRETRQPFTERLLADLASHTPGSRVVALITSHVLFLVAVQPRHVAQLERALGLLSERWPTQVTLTEIPRPNSLEEPRRAVPGSATRVVEPTMSSSPKGLRREVSRRRTTRLSAGPPPSRRLTDGIVTLRVPVADDIERFVRYGSDEALLEGIWIPGPRGADVNAWAEELVRELGAGWTAAGGMHGGGLVIDEREPCVGTIDFVSRGERVVELTYGVAPPYRGRGVASRAARLAADWALTEGPFDRVELRIGQKHAVSRRVADNAGFQFIECFETFVAGTGRTHMDVLYAKTRE